METTIFINRKELPRYDSIKDCPKCESDLRSRFITKLYDVKTNTMARWCPNCHFQWSELPADEPKEEPKFDPATTYPF